METPISFRFESSRMDLNPNTPDVSETSKDVTRPISAKISEHTELESELNVFKVEAYKRLTASQNECESLRQQIAKLSQDLDEAQSFIFSLQPRQQNITETEATAEYSELCETVASWIEYHLGDAIEKKMIREKPIDFALARNFIHLILPAGEDAFIYKDTDEYNIIAAIMQFLKTEIFDRKFYCPLDRRILYTLQEVDKGMKSSEDRTGPDLAARRSWRSEALRALANSDLFQTLLESQTMKLTDSLSHVLHIFVPRTSLRDFRVSVQNSIIKPALRLAHKLQLSTDRFTVNWTTLSRSRPEERARKPPHLQIFECSNLLAHGKSVKFPLESKGIGHIQIEYIMDICPDLSYEKVKGDSFGELKVLKKSKVLVAVKKSDQPLLLTEAAHGEDSTLLGWLYTRPTQKPVSRVSMWSRG